jgi:hypothetical protein
MINQRVLIMKKGDYVYLKEPFWHRNTNLGGKKAIVLSTKSYILVRVEAYDCNPVKCFRNEVTDKPIKLEKKTSKNLKPPDEEGYRQLQNYLDQQLEADESWDSWII